MRHRPHCVTWLAVLALAVVGCGGRVARLSLRDARLTAEARRWLADAQDEVAIARVGWEEASQQLAEARAFQKYVQQDVNRSWPRGRAAQAAQQRLERLTQERIRLAQLQVDAAQQGITLARIQLLQAYAETAVRHDIANHDLEPIVGATATARQQLEALEEQVNQQKAALDQATVQWWDAYGAYLQAGGTNHVLWNWEED